MVKMTKHNFEYDFVISYAGEDTSFAENLKAQLEENGAKVFYAPDNVAQLWGVNLTESLAEIYSKKALFCIPLISENYVRKQWTRHEWRSAQARALKDIDTAYILPIRLDSSELPGLLETTSIVDVQNYSVNEIVSLAIQKLNLPLKTHEIKLENKINSNLNIIEKTEIDTMEYGTSNITSKNIPNKYSPSIRLNNTTDLPKISNITAFKLILTRVSLIFIPAVTIISVIFFENLINMLFLSFILFCIIILPYCLYYSSRIIYTKIVISPYVSIDVLSRVNFLALEVFEYNCIHMTENMRIYEHKSGAFRKISWLKVEKTNDAIFLEGMMLMVENIKKELAESSI